jgi:hypothetical protein
MSPNSVRTTLASAALAFASASALAFFNETPIVGASVSLEHDAAGAPISAVTDAKGNASFAKLAPGHYVVFLPELPERKDPFSVTVTSSATGSFSCLLLKWPGKGHRADLLGKDKKKLVFELGRSGGQLKVHLSTIPSPPKGKSLGVYTPCDGPAK